MAKNDQWRCIQNAICEQQLCLARVGKFSVEFMRFFVLLKLFMRNISLPPLITFETF